MNIKLDLRRAPKQRDILLNLPNDKKEHLKTTSDDCFLISGIYVESKRVADEERYMICRSAKGLSWEKKDCLESRDPAIVLVVESPHKDEYDLDFNPIGPAKGSTGTNLEKHLDELLNQIELPEGDHFKFIISNPVQFQTSLYYLHRKALKNEAARLRDKVWKVIYPRECKYFKKRIDSYNPVVIINACTAGVKSEVGQSLSRWFKNKTDIGLYEANKHPCIWTSPPRLRLV